MQALFKDLDKDVTKLKNPKIPLEDSITTHSHAVHLLEKAESMYTSELDQLDKTINAHYEHDPTFDSKDIFPSFHFISSVVFILFSSYEELFLFSSGQRSNWSFNSIEW